MTKDEEEAIEIMRSLPPEFLREVVNLICNLETIDPHCTEDEFIEYMKTHITGESKPH